MNMLVLVSFGHMQPHANGHESTCDDELISDGFIQSGYGHESTEKRSRRKICGRSSSSQMPQREHIQCKANSVAQETNERRHKARHEAGQRSSRRKAQQQIDRTGYNLFERHDLQRIGKRNLSRQIIVQSPCNAGTDYSERADDAL